MAVAEGSLAAGKATFGVLPEPSAALARHAMREMGWDGRFEVEQLTSRVGRKVLVYNFTDLAGYLLGRDALEKPLIGRLRFMVCRVDGEKLIVWLRNAVGDAELADALDAALDRGASEHDQMVVIRQFLFNRWGQYRKALNAAQGAGRAEATRDSAFTGYAFADGNALGQREAG